MCDLNVSVFRVCMVCGIGCKRFHNVWLVVNLSVKAFSFWLGGCVGMVGCKRLHGV